MRVLVVNNAEKELEGQFAQPIADIVGICGSDMDPVEVTILHWKELREEHREFDAIIASGSSQGDDPMPTHGPVYVEKLDLLRSRTPFFGICTGFHLQAYLRGKPLINMGRSETGFVEISIVKADDPIFKGMGGDTFGAVQMHNDSIDLPPGFVLLASTTRCEVQLVRNYELPIFYCSQFHPEQKEGGTSTYGPAAKLLRNFIFMARGV